MSNPFGAMFQVVRAAIEEQMNQARSKGHSEEYFGAFREFLVQPGFSGVDGEALEARKCSVAFGCWLRTRSLDTYRFSILKERSGNQSDRFRSKLD